MKAKIDDLSQQIDNLVAKKRESTLPRETTYNITEATILRKAFLNEAIGLPSSITEEYKGDQNIINANKKLQERFEQLQQD